MSHHYHFMGIGGVSMQGLARWCRAEGATVSGCDVSESPVLDALRREGFQVFGHHDPAHLAALGVDTLVTTMAVPQDHPERLQALAMGLRVQQRIELLADLFLARRAIGITGTSGKSSTTGMAATLALAAGVDPSLLIGASLPGVEGNVRHGAGPLLVAEVDESDPGFAQLVAEVAVVTNLEDDHVAGEFSERRNYHASLADLENAVRRFAGSAKHALSCADWPGLDELMADHPSHWRYGQAEDADYPIRHLGLRPTGADFELGLPDGRAAQVRLEVPGLYNVMNASAALAACHLAGLDPVALAPALAEFHGVGRRWQLWGEPGGAWVVDDYAHHPTKVRAVLTAARATGRRVRAVLQPHRWVRTARLWPELADAASLADEVLVLDVYAAGEAAIPGVDVGLIVERLRAAGRQADHHDMVSAVGYLRRTMQADDLVLTLGAGDVWQVARSLTEEEPAADGRAETVLP